MRLPARTGPILAGSPERWLTSVTGFHRPGPPSERPTVSNVALPAKMGGTPFAVSAADPSSCRITIPSWSPARPSAFPGGNW